MKKILITGATDGIGFALAQYYQAQGQSLILVGRRSLAELTDPVFQPEIYCQIDLSQEGRTKTLRNFCQAHQIEKLDLVVHNAGVGYYGPVAGQSSPDLETMIALNLIAPIELTYALAPLLQSAKGKVVFISSVVTALPSPKYATYTATKAALDGFARSLRVEWQDNIAIQVIHLGAIRTGMHAKMGLTLAQMNWDKFPSAEIIAPNIAQAISRNRAQVTIGLPNQLLRFSGIYGRSVIDWLMRLRNLQ